MNLDCRTSNSISAPSIELSLYDQTENFITLTKHSYYILLSKKQQPFCLSGVANKTYLK